MPPTLVVVHLSSTDLLDSLSPITRRSARSTLSSALAQCLPGATINSLLDLAYALFDTPMDLAGLELHLQERLKSLPDDLGSVIHPLTAQAPLTGPLERTLRALSHDLYAQSYIESTLDVRTLRHLLKTGSLYCDYHPIVELSSNTILGLEALARTTCAGLENPLAMFRAAARASAVHELSSLCRTRAVEGFVPPSPSALLFINIDPLDFDNSSFTPQSIIPSPSRIEPTSIVLEITEQSAIEDYNLLRQRLAPFLDMGYRFAVDDAGSGYAGLGSIANIDPHFIKLDRGLITDIQASALKQDLVSAMVLFAQEQDIAVIAEGVETQAEAATIEALGVQYVQGFYFHPVASAQVHISSHA